MDGESKSHGGNDQVLSSLGDVNRRFIFESLKLEDLKFNFLALRKLYGLLPNSANVKTENLDEKAQKLLKELLDAALERTFTEYLELIAAQSDICKASSFNQLAQATAASESLVSPDVMMSPSNIVGFYKGLGSQTPSLKKDEGLLSQKAPLEFALQSVTKPDNFKKRCLACQRNSMKQQMLARKDIPASKILRKGWEQAKEFQLTDREAKCATEKNLNQYGPIKSNKNLSLEMKLHDNKHMMTTPSSSHATSLAILVSKLQGRSDYDFPTQNKEQPEKSDPFERDVDNAIRQTKAYISSVQLLSQHVEPFKNSETQSGLCKVDGSATSIIQPKQQAKFRNNAGQVGESITGDLPLWQTNKKNYLSEKSSQIYTMPNHSLKSMGLKEAQFMKSSKNGRQIVNSGDDSNEALSSVNINSKVTGMTTPNCGLSRLKKTCPVNSLMAKANKLEPLSPLTKRDYVASHIGNMVHGLRVPPITEHSRTPRNVEKPLAAIPSRPVDSRSSIYSGNKDKRENKAPHNVITRPSLMDQWSFNKKVPLHTKNRGRRIGRTVHVGHGKEMLSSETESEYRVMPSSETESEYRAMLSSEIESEYSSSSPYTSYSSGSSEGSGTSTSYSEASSSSSYSNYSEASISSEHNNSFEEGRSSYSTSSCGRSGSSKKASQIRKPVSRHKENGGFRRMKNKLGLIFHHHHHHHHHHHSPSNNNHTAITHHGTSMWRHLQNIFHQKRESKKKGGRVVGKRRKSGNTDGRHFHKLVQGFWRHVRRTKKTKPIKRNGIKTQNKKKLHWWQMLRRHGGIKLPNKGKVRLKRSNRRLRLKSS